MCREPRSVFEHQRIEIHMRLAERREVAVGNSERPLLARKFVHLATWPKTWLPAGITIWSKT